jgi:hypothetical protein
MKRNISNTSAGIRILTPSQLVTKGRNKLLCLELYNEFHKRSHFIPKLLTTAKRVYEQDEKKKKILSFLDKWPKYQNMYLRKFSNDCRRKIGSFYEIMLVCD